MIQKHDFNSDWSQSQAGVLFDARFFELPERQRAESLSTFDWVEFRCDLKHSLPIPTIAAAGFVQVDVNLHFRIDLRTVAKTPSCEGLETNRASEKTLRVNSGELPAFANERFRFLPGVDIAKVNERYAVWGNQLVSKSRNGASRFPKRAKSRDGS